MMFNNLRMESRRQPCAGKCVTQFGPCGPFPVWIPMQLFEAWHIWWRTCCLCYLHGYKERKKKKKVDVEYLSRLPTFRTKRFQFFHQLLVCPSSLHSIFLPYFFEFLFLKFFFISSSSFRLASLAVIVVWPSDLYLEEKSPSLCFQMDQERLLNSPKEH